MRFLLAILLLTIGACDAAEPPPWPRVRNVVFVTIDTLRADHTSLGGYPIQTTPFLEEMAAGGITFERAYSHSATTAPSHSSMFTGLYPIQHRVQTNGLQLESAFATLPAVLQRAGWETAAVVSVPVIFRSSALARGFDSFTRIGEVAPEPQYRSADRTVDAAIEWLEQRSDPARPFFLWVHVYDPHPPFRPPAAHLDAMTPSDEAELEQRRRAVAAQHLRRRTQSRNYQQVIEYDAEIRFVDAELRRLHQSTEAVGANDSTLWVVTSDHGEGLGAHNGWFGHHVQIYNSQLHVPLLLRFPDNWEGGRRVAGHAASHVDLAPTVLEILGQPPIEQPLPVQGVSLAPLFGDSPTWERTAIFSERRIPIERGRGVGNAEPKMEEGTRQSLQTLTRKYMLVSDGPDEYYHLDVDPYERNDMIDNADAEAHRLRELLRTLVDALDTGAEATVTVQELEALRALGYVR